MSNKTKLELTWIGKDNPPKLEPRILIEDPESSYVADKKITGHDLIDNRLIFGDNLLALKALEDEFTGKIKCICIDPPYNTGNAFEKYDDGIEHSLWLNLMRARLEILYKLLSDDGVIFVNIDESEHAYLKVMMDSIFSRENFIGDLIWKKRKGGGNDSRFLALDHEYILVYVKNKQKHLNKWRIGYDEKYLKRYKEQEEDGRRYYWDTLSRPGLQNPIIFSYKCEDGEELKIFSQKSEATFYSELEKGNIRVVKTRNGWTAHHKVYMPQDGKVLRSILDEHGINNDAANEMLSIFGSKKAFDYPKPEKLIMTLLDLVTEKGDWVLDSFAGSGTTGAVAHKMGRKWIMIELGDHCHTNIIPRLQKVISGEDQSGITKIVDWKGGGGFRYFRLAPSLLEKDKFGNWIISKQYNPAMLAEAMCKLKGFIYQPDDTLFWKQGQSTETDYIFTTTQLVTRELVDRIQEQMGENETLLICCKAFTVSQMDYPTITFEKIPSTILKSCEYGRDDYSLDIREIEQEEIQEKGLEGMRNNE
ncbi:site-specific DNA-methyltransferase [Cytobacillus oceanisediminis]|uniref:site-specific DNA-methyltransferase n=1 Tax=Cytobacillus oceanisediminis TaxID=665099 RepID=UPI001C22CE3F|nr:site-specific DNA-methyltransferase [Cytobacillus oceanisediminis]MBU8730763.1 site-specific DNA-methyltransferase [Cytobacillus oceanisediminis]